MNVSEGVKWLKKQRDKGASTKEIIKKYNILISKDEKVN